MSTTAGKIVVDGAGASEGAEGLRLQLRFLQARDPELVEPESDTPADILAAVKGLSDEPDGAGIL